MRRGFTACLLATLVVSCGEDKSPTSPASSSGSGAVDWTLSGTIVSNGDARPVAGAAIRVTGGPTVTTNSSGQFSFGGSGTQLAGVRINVSATGYVERGTSVQTGATRGGIVIDMIRDSAPFSSTFYLELVRASLDGGPFTTRRWQEDPSFYVQTIDENGAPVAQWMIDAAVSVIPDIVLDATANHYRAVQTEVGPNISAPSAGQILIKFPAAAFGAAGRASGIGINPCTVQIWQGDVPGAVPQVIAHEISHCLGLGHITVTGLPPTAAGLMGKFGPGSWKLARLTDAEKFHTAILYSRPIGNAHPDIDPNSWLFSTTGQTMSWPHGWIQ
jgi:hypothetical protein